MTAQESLQKAYDVLLRKGEFELAKQVHRGISFILAIELTCDKIPAVATVFQKDRELNAPAPTQTTESVTRHGGSEPDHDKNG